MLLIMLGLILFVVGASQRWEPAALFDRSTERRSTESEEVRWVKQTYAANMMQAGTLLFTCGAAVSFVSL